MRGLKQIALSNKQIKAVVASREGAMRGLKPHHFRERGHPNPVASREGAMRGLKLPETGQMPETYRSHRAKARCAD